MSDIALGIVAIVSFWRSLELQSAVMMWVSIELAGLVYGHFTNFNNRGHAGILPGLTIIHVLLLPLLLVLAYRARRNAN